MDRIRKSRTEENVESEAKEFGEMTIMGDTYKVEIIERYKLFDGDAKLVKIVEAPKGARYKKGMVLAVQ